MNDLRRIAYIGCGLMGAPMVRRLMSLGYRLQVFDVDPVRLDELASAGALTYANTAAAAKGADLVLLNLPTDGAVEVACFGDDGLAQALNSESPILDFSTISPARSVEFQQRVMEGWGGQYLDAPVSGGPQASSDGSLTIMVGGDRAIFERLQAFLSCVGRNIHYIGPSGSASSLKLVSQLIVGVGHVALAEALRLAEGLGLRTEQVPHWLAGGHADGTLLQALWPRLAERDITVYARAAQLLKDLQMVNDAATRAELALKLAPACEASYRTLCESGMRSEDTTAVVRLYERALTMEKR